MATKQTDPNALIGRLIESRAVPGEPSAAEIADRVERCRLNSRQLELREKGRTFCRAYFLRLAKSACHQGIEVLSKTDSERPVGVRIIDADDTEARKITLIKNNDRGTHDPVEQTKVMEYLRAHARDADIAHGLPWTEEIAALLADADRQMREREQEREGAASRAATDPDATLSALAEYWRQPQRKAVQETGGHARQRA